MGVSASLAHLAVASLALFAIAIALAPVLRILRRDPVAAYRAARIALGAALLALPVELLVASRTLRVETAHPKLDRLGARVAEADRAARPAPAPLDPVPLDSAPPAPALDAAPEPRPMPPRGPAENELALAAPSSPAPAPAAGEPSENVLAASPLLDRRALRAIAGVYLAGCLVALGLALTRIRRTRRLLRRCEPIDPARIRALLDDAGAATGVRRFSALVSDDVASPCCAGVFARYVVLPRRDLEPGADPKRVGFALLHELVHLEQRDPAVLAAQRALRIVFWFHPAAIWLSRSLDSLRELACDRIVVARTGRGKSYARALLDYAAVQEPTSAVLDATAMFDRTRRRSQLRRRIEMLSCDRPGVSKSRKLLIAAASGSTLVAVVAFQVTIGSALPAFAGEKESLVAFCPPKQVTAPCGEPAAPLDPPARKDRQAPRQDLKSPKQKPASPEEKNERLRELLASKRGDPADPQAMFVAAGFTPPGSEANLDPDVKRALIKTLLRDDHSTARSTAAAALAPFLREKEVKDAFMSALRDGRDSRLKITVLDELLKREALSDDARELFVRLFAMDNAEYQRISLTEALAPYAHEPDARDALVEALLDDANEPMQLESALALAPHAGDSAVQSAMTRVLTQSGNEVARLVLIDALAAHAGSNEQVRKVFVEILAKDDSAIARVRVADRLAENAADPNVRKAMFDALSSGVSVLIQNRLVDGLAGHVTEPDVKRGFIALLDRVSDEVVKLRLVSSLAGVADASRGKGDAPGAVPLLGTGDPGARLVPIVGRP